MLSFLGDVLVNASHLQWIGERATYSVRQWLIRRVCDLYLKESSRDAGILVV